MRNKKNFIPHIIDTNGDAIPVRALSGKFFVQNGFYNCFWGPGQLISESGDYVQPDRWMKSGTCLQIPRIVRFLQDGWPYTITGTPPERDNPYDNQAEKPYFGYLDKSFVDADVDFSYIRNGAPSPGCDPGNRITFSTAYVLWAGKDAGFGSPATLQEVFYHDQSVYAAQAALHGAGCGGLTTTIRNVKYIQKITISYNDHTSLVLNTTYSLPWTDISQFHPDNDLPPPGFPTTFDHTDAMTDFGNQLVDHYTTKGTKNLYITPQHFKDNNGVLTSVAPLDGITQYFPPKVLNLVVLSFDYGFTGDSNSWPSTELDDAMQRIRDSYANFASYETHIFIDNSMASGVDGVNPSRHLGDHLLTLEDEINTLCNDMEEFGFIYEGTVSGDHLSLSRFTHIIDYYFGLT